MTAISLIPGKLFSNLPIITDFDQTIAFYHLPSSDDGQCVLLPASSSGLVGYLSEAIIGAFERLASGHLLICASGMREATMRSREPFLPMFSYWICENGGKIFSKTASTATLEELPEWREYLLDSSDDKGAEGSPSLFQLFKEFKEYVRDRYCSSPTEKSPLLCLDDDGYCYMFRLKRLSKGSPTSLVDGVFHEIIQQIPSKLRYTFNLGHLDVHLPRCTKYAASRWLLTRLTATGRECADRTPPYIFIGDDDNDVEAASHAQLAIIVHNHSAKMKEYVQSTLSTWEMADNADAHRTVLKLSPSKNATEDRFLWIGKRGSHRGTLDLLQSLLHTEFSSRGKTMKFQN